MVAAAAEMGQQVTHIKGRSPAAADNINLIIQPQQGDNNLMPLNIPQTMHNHRDIRKIVIPAALNQHHFLSVRIDDPLR